MVRYISELTNSPLFDSLLIFETSNGIIDLHNDYDCQNVLYDLDTQSLKCFFEGPKKIILDFEGVIITKFNVQLRLTSDSCILNNFYRGRFETDHTLHEITADGRRYFFLEFEEGNIMELHAHKVFLVETGISA